MENINRLVVPESAYGVCLWETATGMIADSDGNYLSLYGVVGSLGVEARMAEAAKYWMGSGFEGKPHWVRGARQLSTDEYEHQKERMIDGLIPDELEEMRLALREGNVK